jgi:Flp pilus assembly protein TadD
LTTLVAARKIAPIVKDGTLGAGGRKHLVIAAFLAAVTLAVYLPVLGNGFVDLDDHAYIDANPQLRIGLTRSSVAWAFTTRHMGNWHPITWLSHLVDVELFGLDPRGHHLTGAAIHAASTALLFLLARGLSGALWPSALIAALFGLHPLRVESVAWASERKDVLAAFFWICTTSAYLRYARRPGIAAYGAVVCLLLLGLMAKPMLVTLPLTLLLLDFWPLGRLRANFGKRHTSPAAGLGPGRLLLEKAPLLALAAGLSAVALAAQRFAGAVRLDEAYPLSVRVANALVSYLRYLGKTAYPLDLAVFYPHPRADLAAGQAVAAAVALIAASSGAVLLWRRMPYLAVGWFWYLGTLVPVIGLVQIGGEAMADRYTYVPHIGLFVLLVWASRDLWRRFRWTRRAFPALAGAMLAAYAFLTWHQVGYWRDSVTLFKHAVAVTEENWQAHLSLAQSLNKLGRTEEARAEYRELIRLKPGYGASHQVFGVTRSVGGALEKLLEGGEGSASAAAEERFALANSLAQEGRIAEARAEYERLIADNPGHWMGRNNLGVALLREQRTGEAKEQFEESLRLRPRNSSAHGNLGYILIGEGKCREAAGHLEEALRIKPDDIAAMASYAEALLCLGRAAEAERWCREILRLAPGNKRARDLLLKAGARPRVP